MRYISLFAGIGGFDLALNRLGHQCVWANEWDKYAAQIYNKNFEYAHICEESEQENSEQGGFGTTNERGVQLCFGNKSTLCDTRDIRTVPTSEIPDHDLLVGGFPCQAFSIAGKRRGFDDTRGTLFFEVARILKDKQPKFFILENVKGLLSHDSGNTFKIIISTLTELGYDVEWQVLNSKNFGVPQNRERVFIVGHLRGQPRPEVFPIGKNDELPNGENQTEQRRSQAKYSGTLKGSNMKADHTFISEMPQAFRVRSIDGVSSTLQGEAGGTGAKTGLYIVGGLQKHQTPRNDGNSPTLPSAMGMGGGQTPVLLEPKIRRLTPTECERLQGFPDGWTEVGLSSIKEASYGFTMASIVPISDTQRYKCLGNAVTVNVVYEVAKRLGGTK